MGITSVTKDTDAIEYVEDGATRKKSIAGRDTIVSFPIDSCDRIINVWRQQSDGHLLVTYVDSNGDDQTIDIDPSGVSDHGELDGLSDDDHTQYWNNTRGVAGVKTVKLDDLTAPDDNTDLNASSERHGLLLKLENSGSKYLRDDGTWQTIAGGGDMLAATYDPTSVEGDAFDVDNHVDGSTNKVYTATEQTKLSGIATGADVTGDNAPQAHKDSHDPNDGGDPLDCAAAGEIVGVAAAAEGSAHSFARSDHTHQIQHSIADNHIVTVNDADLASGDIVYIDTDGIAGYNEAEFKSAYNMEAGTDYLAQQTIGIADDNLVEIDGSPTDGEVAIFTANGLDSVSTTEILNEIDAATTAAKGIIEIATSAEVNTGTDATRAVSPDGLAGSNLGTWSVEILVSDPQGDAIETGDLKAYFRCPASKAGMNLVDCEAHVTTASSSGAITVQIRNATTPADMLSTALTIDESETDSATAETPASINTSEDDLTEGDIICIDIDGAGTGAKGLLVCMEFRLP